MRQYKSAITLQASLFAITYFNKTYMETDRTKALEWFKKLPFEIRFFHVISWLKSQNRDTTERHPDSLTGREIQEIWRLTKSKV